MVSAKVGARIKARRREVGFSQTDLGAALGVSFQQIQKYEKGTDRISVDRLVPIAAALRVAPAWFLKELGLDQPVP